MNVIHELLGRGLSLQQIADARGHGCTSDDVLDAMHVSETTTSEAAPQSSNGHGADAQRLLDALDGL